MLMASAPDHVDDRPTITYLRTDIDCFACFERVRQALEAQPHVETVEEVASTGCFVVTHRSDPEQLRRVVAEVGHRVVMADNGEVGMGAASATTVVAHHSCGNRAREGETR